MPQIEEITSALAEPESSLEASSSQKIALSIVVPVMNEEQNVRPLYQKLSDQLNSLGQNYEVLFVDDGSTDNTFRELKTLHEEHPGTIRVIRFRRNFGKTPALVAGFSRCQGEIIFTMDGDLQDDPEAIPRKSMKGMTWYRVGNSRVSIPLQKHFLRVCLMAW